MVACVCACVCSRMATVCTLLYTRILRGLFDSYPAGFCVCIVFFCMYCVFVYVCMCYITAMSSGLCVVCLHV